MIRLILKKAKGAADSHKAGQHHLKLWAPQLLLSELQLHAEPQNC